MLGPSTTECNWLLITLDTTRFRESGAIEASAEEVLAELRNCPPAPGFERVEVPGARERNHLAAKFQMQRVQWRLFEVGWRIAHISHPLPDHPVDTVARRLPDKPSFAFAPPLSWDLRDFTRPVWPAYPFGEMRVCICFPETLLSCGP